MQHKQKKRYGIRVSVQLSGNLCVWLKHIFARFSFFSFCCIKHKKITKKFVDCEKIYNFATNNNKVKIYEEFDERMVVA